MRISSVGKMAAGVAWLVVALTANGTPILEIERNDSLAAAQNVEGSFSNSANGDIENSALPGWEWVSISGTGDDTFDYYSFSAQSGQTFIFDIDFGFGSTGSLDTELGLWAVGGGSALSQIDDCWSTQNVFVNPCVPDSGSTSTLDPILEWTFASAGTYVIGVGEFNSFDAGGGFGGNEPNSGETYTLQISRDMAMVLAEPGTLVLLGIGLAGMGLARRRKKV